MRNIMINSNENEEENVCVMYDEEDIKWYIMKWRKYGQ